MKIGSTNEESYGFVSWNTVSDGSGNEYLPGSPPALSGNITLYGQYGDFRPGNKGPAGGFVFYDKGSYSDGWRYMEAAPDDQSLAIPWCSDTCKTAQVGIDALPVDKGSGYMNTIAVLMKTTSADPKDNSTNNAAKLCIDMDLVNEGKHYTMWFLPSLDELKEMNSVLNSSGLGDFSQTWYWSSSESDPGHAISLNFENSTSQNEIKTSQIHVRAARLF